MRIAYLANHDVGCACLRALLSRGLAPQVAVVLPRGREHLEYASVADEAAAAGIPVWEFRRGREEELADLLARLDLDLLLSVAWRHILPQALLDLPRLGAVNFHGSLLPRCRGAHPTNWAIISGEDESGVSVHFMDAGIDTGDIILQQALPIRHEDTALSLRLRQDALSVELMHRLAELLLAPGAGPLPRRKQDEARATTFRKRGPADGLLRWEGLSPRQARDFVRGQTRPYPGAFCPVGQGVLRLWRAEILEEPCAGATPGAVLRMEGRLPVVAVGQGALLIAEYDLEGPAPALRPGLVLGPEGQGGRPGWSGPC